MLDRPMHKIARSLSHATKIACMKMTTEWTAASNTGFSHGAAYFLERSKEHLCEKTQIEVVTKTHEHKMQDHFRLTAKGVELKKYLETIGYY